MQFNSGELRHVVGKVIAVDAVRHLLRVRTQHESFEGVVEVEEALACRHIKAGQHVKVIAGPHMGRTGSVVYVKENGADGDDMVAAVLTDSVNTEIMCSLNQLQVSSDVSIGFDNLNGYELYDLVVLSQNEVAVVVGVGTEFLQVINQMGVVKQVNPVELRGKRNDMSARTQAFDSQHNSISCGDVVNVLEGNHAKQAATVKHIYKSMLWLHSNVHMKNAGIFTARAKTVTLAGNKIRPTSFADSYMGVLSPHHTPVGMSPSHGGSVRPPGSRKGSNEEIGTTVRIVKGAYKGHLAQIVNSTETHLSVELLSKLKKVTIDRESTVPAGTKEGALRGADARGGGGFGFGGTSDTYQSIATPYNSGSETPSHSLGDQTPLRGEGWSVTEDDISRANAPPMTQPLLRASASSMSAPVSSFSGGMMQSGGGSRGGGGSGWAAGSSGWGDSSTVSAMGSGSGGGAAGWSTMPTHYGQPQTAIPVPPQQTQSHYSQHGGVVGTGSGGSGSGGGYRAGGAGSGSGSGSGSGWGSVMTGDSGRGGFSSGLGVGLGSGREDAWSAMTMPSDWGRSSSSGSSSGGGGGGGSAAGSFMSGQRSGSGSGSGSGSTNMPSPALSTPYTDTYSPMSTPSGMEFSGGLGGGGGYGAGPPPSPSPSQSSFSSSGAGPSFFDWGRGVKVNVISGQYVRQQGVIESPVTVNIITCVTMLLLM